MAKTESQNTAHTKSGKQRNSLHILAYLMDIDKAIRNGDYPNANKMNAQIGWNLS